MESVFEQAIIRAEYGKDNVLTTELLEDTRDTFSTKWLHFFRCLREEPTSRCPRELQKGFEALYGSFFSRLVRSVQDADVILEMSLELYSDTEFDNTATATDDAALLLLHEQLPFEFILSRLSVGSLKEVARSLCIPASDSDMTRIVSAIHKVYADGVGGVNAMNLYSSVRHRLVTELGIKLFFNYVNHITSKTILDLQSKLP